MTDSKRLRWVLGLFFCVAMAFSPLRAEQAPKLRVGVLKFGTVNWELHTMMANGLDKANGLSLEVVPFGGKNASAVALQGKAVDVIVSDWIWVSRQRSKGAPYTFFPYSNAVGGMVVSPKSGIQNLSDLAGKRLGIAGGPVDKAWLLYQAQAKKQYDIDLSKNTELMFAAPPLLNKVFAKGELDAAITFWHFRAKLLAAGNQALSSVPEIYQDFNIKSSMPLLGWVFSDKLAADKPKLIEAFLNASYQTKALLKKDDEAWTALRPKLKAKNDAEAQSLKNAYRAGIPEQFGEAEISGAKKAYGLLSKWGGAKLVGDATELSDGTFWLGYQIP